ncbi:hypothetical protein ACQKOF_19860 [Lysinibacillus sp. NPDC093190]|uniref:hypothetical protein n=1 Tax=Lysinibacillus sp. NPDC093190 TaxID=3390575 RepID=UPI003D04F9E3
MIEKQKENPNPNPNQNQNHKEKLVPGWVYILIGVILFVVPSVFAGLMTIDFFSFAPGGTDGWLSYWGAYLGGIIGMIAVVATTQYIVSNQNKQQKEQMEEQRKQHLELLKNQNKQHQEQLDVQRKAIEENDIKEKNRMFFTFLSRQNEEVLEVLLKINELNSKRFNHIRGIADYWELQESIKKELRNDGITDIKRQELIGKGTEYNVRINRLKDDETIVRGELLVELAKLRIKAEYFPESFEKAQSFKKYQENLLDIYESHIRKEDLLPVDLLKKIENDTDNNLAVTNKILGEFTYQLQNIILKLKS